MTKEERDFINGAFGDSSTHIFDKGEDALRMQKLLDRLGVRHEIGSFHHVVNGKGRFDAGINIKDKAKLAALLREVPSEKAETKQPAATKKGRRSKKVNL